jgi:hypothetical protein
MPRRRTLVLSVTVGAALLAFIGVALVLRSGPPPVWQLRGVLWWDTSGVKPRPWYGDREVSANFDYVGPDLCPPVPHGIRLALIDIVVLKWPRVPISSSDVILSDENGRELARLPASEGSNATVSSARIGCRSDVKTAEGWVTWDFRIPPGVDSSRPIRFSTSIGVNSMPKVKVETTLMPLPPKAPLANH